MKIILVFMDKKNIESAAISEVKDVILSCDILSPYISENDKEPSWDGFIYVYNDNNQTKNNIRGRVAVQVKGELNSNFSFSEISYSAEITDLNNYLKDNGVIYFVVYINKQNPRQRKVYYETLTPVKLALKLKSNKNKTNLSIKLREFPSDSNLQKVIFLNFLKDSKQQVSYAPQNIISLSDLKMTNLRGFTYLPEHSLIDIQSLCKFLNDSEIYFYISDGSKNMIPTDFFTSSEMKLGIMDSIDSSISVKNKIYYNSFRRTFSGDSLTIQFGNSFTIVINNETGIANFKIELTPFARKGMEDLPFLINTIKNKNQFFINEREINFTQNSNCNQEEHLIVLEKNLMFYNKVVELLDTLNVRMDLDLSKLSSKEKLILDILFKAILEKKDVDIVVEDDNSLINAKIADIQLKLVAIKNENGSYILRNFFDPEFIGVQKNDNGDARPASIFSILEKDDYINVSNINQEIILDSYRRLSNFDHIYQIAVLDMLKMLLAYDNKPSKELFSLIKDISDWIFEESKDNIPIEIKLLNRLQIIKRERDFNEGEKAQLVQLNENSDVECKLAANILLGYKDAARIYFNKLSKERQEIFKSFPIYRFYKDLNV